MKRILLTPLVLFFALLLTNPSLAADLKVMKTGLGDGIVTSVPGGISCGADCDETYGGGTTTVVLTAAPDADSRFVRWEGGASGTGLSVTVDVTANRVVRAVFELLAPINPLPLASLTPAGIRAYLALPANAHITTPARFIAALPREFRQNWLLMSRSESLQTGTAKYPRVLMSSIDATYVFTVGLATHSSYPGSHPNAIEFMQWDPAQKNFRFHEVILDAIPPMGAVPARSRMISIDDKKCSKCHSTRNVLNRSSFPGTTGLPPRTPPDEVVKSKNKPNWDAYDSWAGMMPFNRDRIYQGSIEDAAFRQLFNLWNWRESALNDDIRQFLEQLELQPPYVVPPSPHSITRNIDNTTNAGHIVFGYDGLPAIPTTTASTDHTFGGLPAAATSVTQGGRYVTLRHPAPIPVPGTANDDYSSPGSDEGRGVQLFDLLGGLDGDLNPLRIADELIDHRWATGSVPIDVRPIALAIARSNLSSATGPLRINTGANTMESNVVGEPLTIDLSFFNARGLTINDLVADTRARAQSLPRRKADLQKRNIERTGDIYVAPLAPSINGLIQEYDPGSSTAIARLRQEVFQRPVDLGSPAATINGSLFVDRELYGYNTNRVAAFRYFLEPLGVSVDKWSMGVRGRSRTYTFADVFASYIGVFITELSADLVANPVTDPGTGLPLDPAVDADLIKAINKTLGTLPAVDDVPKFTDVQRVFNKGCIECHGGLEYPPYVNFGSFVDFSENEDATGVAGDDRLKRSFDRAIAFTTTNPATSRLYQLLIRMGEECPIGATGMMPCEGPALSQADVETIRRWIVGPPSRPYTHGDPHIKTVDGTGYDFQAAGEYVLLRGQNLELQARHTAVETNAPLGPNAHTGLTTCVSVNTAVAVRVGGNRITYQPNLSGEPDPKGLELRVDGELVQLGADGIPLSSGGRIVQTSAEGGIQIEAPGGTRIIVTPGWWSRYQLWYLNIDTRHVRAREGLMGAIAPGNWLPALPNGRWLGPMPEDLGARYKILYGVFGRAWQVNDSTSLFDYAAGESPATFLLGNWPGGQDCSLPPSQAPGQPPLQGLAKAVAEQHCGDILDDGRRVNCILDLMATGEVEFAKTYLAADKIDRNVYPDAPELRFPADYDTLSVGDLNFRWNETWDKDGDDLSYRHYVWPVDDAPNNNDAVAVDRPGFLARGSWKCAGIAALIGLVLLLVLYFFLLKEKRNLMIGALLLVLLGVFLAFKLCGGKGGEISKPAEGLQPGQSYFWKVIVEDGKGGTVESETRRFTVR